jgi:hypothetical protein
MTAPLALDHSRHTYFRLTVSELPFSLPSAEEPLSVLGPIGPDALSNELVIMLQGKPSTSAVQSTLDFLQNLPGVRNAEVLEERKRVKRGTTEL